MTCIVGLVDKGKVYIGGDTMGVDLPALLKCTRKDEKVFIKDDFIFGFAGSYRLGQIVRYKLNAPDRKVKQTDFEYLVADWLTSLREVCKEEGMTKVDDNVESIEGGLLFGYKGKLYTVEEDFQIGEVDTPYWSIGCGDHFALGSLATTQKLVKNKRISATNRIRMALETAEFFSAGVGGPFNILNI